MEYARTPVAVASQTARDAATGRRVPGCSSGPLVPGLRHWHAMAADAEPARGALTPNSLLIPEAVGYRCHRLSHDKHRRRAASQHRAGARPVRRARAGRHLRRHRLARWPPLTQLQPHREPRAPDPSDRRAGGLPPHPPASSGMTGAARSAGERRWRAGRSLHHRHPQGCTPGRPRPGRPPAAAAGSLRDPGRDQPGVYGYARRRRNALESLSCEARPSGTRWCRASRMRKDSRERCRFSGDPAGVGTEVAEGGRGAAVAVPARDIQPGPSSGVGPVPRCRRRAVRDPITRLIAQWQDEPIFRGPFAGRAGLCLPVSRRHRAPRGAA